MMAPTDRSMPRVAMTRVMPSARIATWAPRFSTSIRLPKKTTILKPQGKEVTEDKPVDEKHQQEGRYLRKPLR